MTEQLLLNNMVGVGLLKTRLLVDRRQIYCSLKQSMYNIYGFINRAIETTPLPECRYVTILTATHRSLALCLSILERNVTVCTTLAADHQDLISTKRINPR